MRCPGAYGYEFKMRKACSDRCTTREARSSSPARALQNTQPEAGLAPPMYAMRHGAHNRCTPGADSSGVDELAQPLADLEEGNALLRNVHAGAGLGIAALARVAVTDAEAAEATQLDLVALGEGIGDVVEDRVDDRLGFLLGQIRQLRDLVDQIRFGHRRRTSDNLANWTPPAGHPL